MQKWIKVLTGLMIAQLIAVIIVHAPKLGTSQKQQAQLLSLSAEQATKITLSAQDEAPLNLVKTEGIWTLPDYHQLNVDPDKINGFLKKLDEINPSWPVATTTQAQERFEVSEDKYQRKIEIDFENQEPITLYLGTSPGYRKTHARLADDDAIYSVKFSNYEAATTPDNWFDQKLFTLEADRIKQVKTNTVSFEQEKQQWQVSGLVEHEVSQPQAVKDYVSQLANLSVDKALGTDPSQINTGENPTHEITVIGTEDKPITYTLSLLDSGAAYSLKSSSSEVYFELSKAQGDALTDPGREDFVSVVIPPQPPETVQTQEEDTVAETDNDGNAEADPQNEIIPETNGGT